MKPSLITAEALSVRVKRWAREAEGVKFSLLHEQIEYLADQLFNDFDPTAGPAPDFRRRLKAWLDRTPSEEHQQVLFELVTYLVFVGQRQFTALYRAAFHGNVVHWLTEVLGFQVDSVTFSGDIEHAISQTLFCGMTDSMNIAAFHHANRIHGREHRPTAQWLRTFGGTEALAQYMRDEGYARVVVTEDFVGSGETMSDILPRVVDVCQSLLPLSGEETPENLPRVLMVPLIVSDMGAQAGQALASQYSELDFSPVLTIPENAHVRPGGAGEESFLGRVREVVLALEDAVRGQGGNQWFGPFGHNSVGSLVVMHSNCPDSTLPLVHRESDSWSPLFPRSSRH